MNSGAKGRNGKSKSLRIIGASVAAAALYGFYKYCQATVEPVTTGQISVEDKEGDDLIKSGNLNFKHNSDISISLVITDHVLKKIEKFNHNKNNCGDFYIDLQSYLKHYPKLVIILYPGLSYKNIEEYFEIDEVFKSRILETGAEESIFHILKQLNSNINLIDFQGFKTDQESINKNFRLDASLSNLIELKDSLFTNYI